MVLQLRMHEAANLAGSDRNPVIAPNEAWPPPLPHGQKRPSSLIDMKIALQVLDVTKITNAQCPQLFSRR